MKLKSFLVSLFIIHYSLFISGCGYKPASYYAKKEINGLVYTNIDINIDSTANSVLLKDTMNNMVLTQLGSELTDDKAKADTIVDLNLSNVSHSALTSDDEGYARTYRAKVSIIVKYTKKDAKTKNFSVSDYYDYNVASDVTLSEQIKDNAVQEAVKKALQELLSKSAVSNFKTE